jgi:hypothetical protein
LGLVSFLPFGVCDTNEACRISQFDKNTVLHIIPESERFERVRVVSIYASWGAKASVITASSLIWLFNQPRMTYPNNNLIFLIFQILSNEVSDS